VQNEQYEKDLIDFNENLTKAKEIIRELLLSDTRKGSDWTGYLVDLKERAEQFLKEEENDNN
jgi:flagellin-specific chaperone FliS